MSTNPLPNSSTSIPSSRRSTGDHHTKLGDRSLPDAELTKPRSQAEPPPRTRLISAEELATMLSVSKRTIWRLLSGKQLPEPVRIGGSVRWRREQIDLWIEQGCPVHQQPQFH